MLQRLILIGRGLGGMKAMIKEGLFGLLAVFLITVFEFLVTLPLGAPTFEFGSEEHALFLNYEFLLTAIPALFVTYFLAKARKTQSIPEALRRSIVWTLIIFLNYFILGIGNDILGIILGTAGLYVLLAFAFAGPILYVKRKA